MSHYFNNEKEENNQFYLNLSSWHTENQPLADSLSWRTNLSFLLLFFLCCGSFLLRKFYLLLSFSPGHTDKSVGESNGVNKLLLAGFWARVFLLPLATFSSILLMNIYPVSHYLGEPISAGVLFVIYVLRLSIQLESATVALYRYIVIFYVNRINSLGKVTIIAKIFGIAFLNLCTVHIFISS